MIVSRNLYLTYSHKKENYYNLRKLYFMDDRALLVTQSDTLIFLDYEE